MLGNLIGGFIVILIGVTLAPTVANQIQAAKDPDSNATTPSNITGSSATILGLTTLFYCLSVAAAGIGIATVGLRQSGLM